MCVCARGWRLERCRRYSKGCGCERVMMLQKMRKEDRKRTKEMLLNRRREWASGIVGENLSKTVKEKKVRNFVPLEVLLE